MELMGEGAVVLCVLITSRPSPESTEENCEESKDSSYSDSDLVPLDYTPEFCLKPFVNSSVGVCRWYTI